MNHWDYYDQTSHLAYSFRKLDLELSKIKCGTDDVNVRLYGIFQDCRRILEDRLLRGEDAEVVSPRSDQYSIKCLGSRVVDD